MVKTKDVFFCSLNVDQFHPGLGSSDVIFFLSFFLSSFFFRFRDHLSTMFPQFLAFRTYFSQLNQFLWVENWKLKNWKIEEQAGFEPGSPGRRESALSIWPQRPAKKKFRCWRGDLAQTLKGLALNSEILASSQLFGCFENSKYNL